MLLTDNSKKHPTIITLASLLVPIWSGPNQTGPHRSDPIHSPINKLDTILHTLRFLLLSSFLAGRDQ
jgi:hypothetical protein